ncbi:LysR family transcriptional regulator [Hansschlegelia sp. KR7-227]|uniref:LysR family transcriptional regulator n=1 Tax=Hansschlegelia sp. KR7-227 TaxID=3400914 RepID=UPI003BFCCBF9
MRFDLTDLRLFLHVAEAGSITAGAARAHLALASASERIRGMEELAATPLLERERRGVRLTPAGRALAHHARVILDDCERMRGELAAYGRGLKGHVRMMANTSALSEHLPEPLAAFLAANAHVDIDLAEGLSRDIAQAVAAGRVDFGVMSDTVDVAELVTRPFRRDAFVLVAARGHPLAGRKRVAFAETLDCPHVGLEAGSAAQDYLAGQARRLGRSVALRVRVRGFDAVCRMVEQGVGVGVLPAAAARRARRSMAIRAVPLSDPWATRTLVVATRPGGPAPSPHAQALIDWLLGGPASSGS